MYNVGQGWRKKKSRGGLELYASPLAFSGIAAIGCFRASPYDGIYIKKNYSKLNIKKSANLECKMKFFLFSGKF